VQQEDLLECQRTPLSLMLEVLNLHKVGDLLREPEFLKVLAIALPELLIFFYLFSLVRL